MSIQDIRLNSQDTSNFYLANIYQTLDPNRSTLTPLPPSPPPFTPPNYAIWVNSLWFLSLVISITCALLATLLQQWARRYLKVTQPRYSPHKRARIRSFFAEGVEKALLPRAVETLPTLLHMSMFLFFAGLVVFLRSVDLTIFKLVLSWVGVCTALYGYFTFMPIFRPDSPYYTPLSLPMWHIVTATLYIVFRSFVWLNNNTGFLTSVGLWNRCMSLRTHYHKLLVHGMEKRAEETALELSSEIDTRAFMWTFDILDEDHELERFFSGLPTFCNSKVVEDPLLTLADEQKENLLNTLLGFLERTFSSDLLTETVKNRRAAIFRKSFRPVYFSTVHWQEFDILYDILSSYSGPVAAEIVQSMEGWANNGDGDSNLLVQAAVCSVVARMQDRDDSWFILASQELGVTESVLQDYAVHDDSLSLAVLIHVARQQFNHFWKSPWPWGDISDVLLEAASKINAQDTSPELCHEFCSLWNQIVLKAQSENDGWMAFYILGRIRKVYITLHRDTDSAPTHFSASTGDRDDILWKPSSYPLCNIPGYVQHDSASVAISFAVQRDDASPVHACTAIPNAPPSSLVPAQLHVDESLTDVRLPDKEICAPEAIQSTHQTVIDNLHIPATSSDSAATQVMQSDASELTRMVNLSPPEILAPTPRTYNALTPPNAIAIQYLTGRRTPSGAAWSSPLDDIAPTGAPSSSDFPVTSRTNHAVSSPESDPPMLVPAASGPSYPRTPSAPDSDAAAEGSGGANMRVAFLQEAETRYSSSPVSLAAPDFGPHSPSPLSVPDVAIAGPSRRSLDVERTGDRVLNPSHGPYNIV